DRLVAGRLVDLELLGAAAHLRARAALLGLRPQDQPVRELAGDRDHVPGRGSRRRGAIPVRLLVRRLSHRVLPSAVWGALAPKRLDTEHLRDAVGLADDGAPAAARDLLAEGRRRLDDAVLPHLLVEGAEAGLLALHRAADHLDQVAGRDALRVRGRRLGV